MHWEMQFKGASNLSPALAQQNASAQALLHLQAYDERSLRSMIGLPHRQHIAELDGVRDCLRMLKRRYKVLGQEKCDEAHQEIGKLYKAIDNTETKLIEKIGFCD